MACPRCGADNRATSKFCSKCGAAMARTCAHCGSQLPADSRFCDECGTPVAEGVPQQHDVVAPASEGAVAAQLAAAERRLVSVLFADLVGFTTLSEKRDAEQVRELLTQYFEICRSLVARYGGVVEKFIGDAVMAVWGAPVAHEDDAERAVRAALDLVEAIGSMGHELGESGLQARVGVLTGAAAVTLGAEAQGMVAGDLVNTASRIQSVARPGTVLVGEDTRLATEVSVVYEDAGEHTLRGRSEPVRLSRALRVVAGRGGAQKSEGLEAPFVGRERELRLIKDLFHTSEEQRKAHLVSVIGIAGIGKTRLVWEFFKYIDGLIESIRWHRGRCLAYGEGVTYWALAEMVRMRAGIAEGEEQSSARQKLQACLSEHVPDAEERRWVEPRLAQLIAIDEAVSHDRDDLFSAWRLFFERLATRPTVLVFEDMQWADASLLEFIEYLLEWSRNHPLFVVTSARPELMERHATWGAGKRNFTSIYLEPLAQSAMEQLIDSLVPGLPDEVREQVLQRAEGVPLYAVETVRMLLDRGLLQRAGTVYRITGPIEDLAVPQSLQGLIAARLDGLRPEARRVLQDASVLGKTFTVPSLAAVSGIDETQLEPLLTELVRKEVLSVQSDPRSPERGQYGFLQDLVKRVAYGTLSKRDRKAKHLDVAAWFEQEWTGEERDVIEVVASHYLEAYNLAPTDADAEQIRDRAAEVLVQAGDRAASLAANAEAERYFDQAAQLAGGVQAQAELHERAGRVAARAGKSESAIGHYERAIELFEGEGMAHAAARVSALLGRVMSGVGQHDAAIDRMERALTVLEGETPDADLAIVMETLGSLHYFVGNVDRAADRLERALDVAEALFIPEVLSQALNTKALIALKKKHPVESHALFAESLAVALENDITTPALRAYFNSADALVQRDRYAAGIAMFRDCLALAQRVGDSRYEKAVTGALSLVLTFEGDWDEVSRMSADVTDATISGGIHDFIDLLLARAELCVNRGDAPGLQKSLVAFEPFSSSSDVQEQSVYEAARAAGLQMAGRHDEALQAGQAALNRAVEWAGASHQAVKIAFVNAVEAGFALQDWQAVGQLLTFVDVMANAERPPYLSAHAARFSARRGAALGDDAAVAAGFASAIDQFRDIGCRFWVAASQLEYAEWLHARAQSAEAQVLVEAAAETLEALRAQPWVERARRLRSVEAVAS